MMFNEYMDHANQCAGYYSVTRKEEISLQQSETNRFKQKWLEVAGNNNYPPQAPQNPTPPPPGNGGPFNKNGYQQPGHIKQEPHPPGGGYMNGQGQYANGQYKGPPPMKPPGHMDGNQHMMRQHQQHPYQQSQYQQPQFIPNNSMKDNSSQQQQHMKQPQKRQSPSPMIPATANNNYSQHSYENPTKKFGLSQHPLNNSTNSQVPNNNGAVGLKNSNSSQQLAQQQPANAPNGPSNNGSNSQKMYHSNPAMMQQQQGNPNYPNMHPNSMPHQNGYKPPYQQQPGPPKGNYMHHNQQQQQQQQQSYPHPHQQPKHSQQQQPGPPKNQPYPGNQQQQEYNLDLKSVPQRINSPIHSQPSPYPQIHSNGPVDNMNSPKDVNTNGFSKKLSSSSLVQQQQQPHNKPSPMDLPIKSPALPVRSTTPSISMHTIDNSQQQQQQQLVQKSPVRMMTQSPSNSSLNTSICVPTPMNTQNLIDLNQDQLITDDCDSGSLLSPLNNTNPPKMTTSLSFQNSKGSILSEINFDELFMHYPKVFEELFYSFKLNSIEQIEHELRTYCEQQFKLNFSKQNTNWSSSNAGHQQSSIRI